MYPLSAPHTGPIGVFDSGYGGLTILGKFIERLPQYDYLYLGDNARAPYGTRSFEVVYDFTLQAVKKLFELGCRVMRSALEGELEADDCAETDEDYGLEGCVAMEEDCLTDDLDDEWIF